MATKQYLDLEGTSKLIAGVKTYANSTFVAKEYKTGSSSTLKVLSDNNLTDAMVAKIEKAGDSDFSGDYDDLTDKPTLNGVTLSGAQTSTSLGLASAADLTSATADMATKTYVTGLGYDTTDSVNSKIADAKADLQASITAAATASIKPKGSVAFADLPIPAKGILGDMYNVSDAFTTTASFTEGSGKEYPAGTNVVCVASGTDYLWDVQGGFYDLTPYAKSADFVAITDSEIDTMLA